MLLLLGKLNNLIITFITVGVTKFHFISTTNIYSFAVPINAVSKVMQDMHSLYM